MENQDYGKPLTGLEWLAWRIDLYVRTNQRVVADGNGIAVQSLQRLFRRAEKDDINICTKIDRFGRNAADMINTVDTCYKKGIAIRFLENGLSTEGKREKDGDSDTGGRG